MVDLDEKTRLHVEVADLGGAITALADEIREQLTTSRGDAAYRNLRALADLQVALQGNLQKLATLLRQDGKVIELPVLGQRTRSGS